MNSDFESLLQEIRESSSTTVEQGRRFEELARIYFQHDRTQQGQFSEVKPYADWAQERGLPGQDIGVDLVAKGRHDDGWCAIQAKFYSADFQIQKSDIDSFLASSEREEFVRRILVDTTERELSKNVQRQIDHSAKTRPTTRVTLHQLAESSIDWSSVLRKDTPISQRPRKSPRPHQTEAIEKTLRGFKDGDRGQLIMACGTGKTYTGLEIAQRQAGAGRSVLVLVPSLALMSQTISEWTQDARVPLRSFAVCSDVHVGASRRRSSADEIVMESQDLVLPATTDACRLAKGMAGGPPGDGCMDVVFSTYQSLSVIEQAQKEHGLCEFDLIICDEAHRTTGQIKADTEASHFVIVHNQERIRGRRRLYMTATPRVYSEGASRRAVEGAMELCSMDDPDRFGPVFHYQGFASAVADGLLTDYRVIVLALDEAEVSEAVKDILASQGSELNLDDATKIVGCYKALMKQGEDQEFSDDPEPSARALAFCGTIKDSERISSLFPQVVDEYREGKSSVSGDSPARRCELRHVDGSMNAKRRNASLEWLADGSDACRVLSNVRCLGEGVDVPALDAILFLHPRNSQIDVVQSVGRVMRRSPGKRMGYVVLPIGIPPGVRPEDALNDNQAYRVVWQVLNALRSHDERLGAELMRSQLGEGEGLGDRVKVVYGKLAETAVVDLVATDGSTGANDPNLPIGARASAGMEQDASTAEQESRQFQLRFALSERIHAKIIQKCGVAYYWSDWAEDVARIAGRHVTRIGTVLDQSKEALEKFAQFVDELRDDLNPFVTEEEAVQMLAQHLITRPVFEALFQGSSFTGENSVSQAMQSVVDVLDRHGLEKESASLADFYDSVRSRAEQVLTQAGRQNLIQQLYERFFQKAFRQLTERLGIVFTPVELVDYILRSVDAVLKWEFDCELTSEGVHVLDPFAGTGTFLARLMELDLIADEDLPRKYRAELHANEIVPLAYYIAGINIEQAYHGRTGTDAYEAFDGLCLTDTFQQSERSGGKRLAELFPQNDRRLERLSNLDVRVIVGNPPYSARQKSQDDNASNLRYPILDARIEDSYALKSTAANKNSLYDSYIRAIRWASDRIGEKGVIGFVTNAGFLESNSADGLRACLTEEFSQIWVLNLRGNQRTSGEISRKEGGKVFGSGSRAPIAVTLFVKNPDATERGKILYHDIGDYLTREQKLGMVEGFKDVSGTEWTRITPGDRHEWLNKGREEFETFVALGGKGSESHRLLFEVHSVGLATSRDAWCWNFSPSRLAANVKKTTAFYNKEVQRLSDQLPECRSSELNSIVEYDLSSVSWSSSFFQDLARSRRKQFQEQCVQIGTYRPFTKQNLYFSKQLNHRVSQFPRIFPTPAAENRVICVRGRGSSIPFSVLMVDKLPDYEVVSKCQCFPRHIYKEPESTSVLGASPERNWGRRDAISDASLERFANAYPGLNVTKDDVFHYAYGLLHSPDYRSTYANNLFRSLPRVPFVKEEEDFVSFADAGRRLGELHLGYESTAMHPVLINGNTGGMDKLSEDDFHVTKMRFVRKGKERDRSSVQYNERIRVTDIPIEAYQYVVNGKPAIEWVMQRQGVTVHKDSGIVNDANDFAREVEGDPAYPLKLLLRVITVSLETRRIVSRLPVLRIRAGD